MGCWQETCALTLTPIYEGERCVMLSLDEGWLKLHLKYFPIDAIGTRSSDSQWKMFTGVHRGTYNDYGWLRELDARDKFTPCSFFHEAVWDWALEHAKSLRDGDATPDFECEIYRSKFNDLVVTDWLRDIVRVSRFALSLRRNIFSSLSFQGVQESVDDERKYELLDFQRKILDGHRKRFEERE